MLNSIFDLDKGECMFELITLSSLVKVFSDEKPTAKQVNRISVLNNEKASFQLAVCADSDCIANVELTGDIAKDIHLYYVEEIFSRTPASTLQDDYTLRRKAGMFPELLRKLDNKLALEKDKWKSIWIELSPTNITDAGEHSVKVSVEINGEKKEAEFIFDVIGTSLPKQSLIFTNWFHTDCIATHYKVDVFSDEYWKLVEDYLKVACDYGMNMVLTPLFTPPLDTKIGGERPTVQLVGVTQVDGVYSFDFNNFKKWVAMCNRVGIQYFELSHLFTQWGAKKCPKIMATVDGEYKRIFGWNTRASGKKYKKFLSSFAPALKNCLKELGINDRIYVHVSDEPNIMTMRSYRKAAKLIMEHFGEYPIIDALSDYKFYKKGLVKLPIPSNDHVEHFISNVPELWTYYCCSQVKGVANRFFSMPSQRNRILGYQLYKYDVKGFLHWGFNFWYKQYSVSAIDPFTETDAGGSFPSGDSFVVYPGEDGTPLLSLRLKVFYDAFQDLRALRLLETYIGRDATLALLEQDTSPTLTFSTYPHSDEWQLAKREQINSAIREHIKK